MASPRELAFFNAGLCMAGISISIANAHYYWSLLFVSGLLGLLFYIFTHSDD